MRPAISFFHCSINESDELVFAEVLPESALVVSVLSPQAESNSRKSSELMILVFIIRFFRFTKQSFSKKQKLFTIYFRKVFTTNLHYSLFTNLKYFHFPQPNSGGIVIGYIQKMIACCAKHSCRYSYFFSCMQPHTCSA